MNAQGLWSAGRGNLLRRIAIIELVHVFMASITPKIDQEVIRGLKEKNALRVEVLRMLKSAIKNREIELKRELTEEEAIAVLRSQVKSREESAREFEKGGREDLVSKELAEVEILKEFLPQPLAAEELLQIARECVDEAGVAKKSEIGKVMPGAIARAQGRAGGKEIRDAILSILE